MAVWTLTIQEIINYFSALTGAKVSADVSELVKDLHINRSEETYPYLAPVGLGSTLIQLVRGFPATTGGQKLAPLFQSITTDGTYYTATDAGVITQIPAKDFTFSLLNALGVSVTALSDAVWTSVCNALSNIYGKEVTVDNITEFMVLAVVQNGSLFFDEATIKAWSDALHDEGFFNAGVRTNFLEAGGEYIVGHSATSVDDLQNFLDDVANAGYSVPAGLSASLLFADLIAQGANTNRAVAYGWGTYPGLGGIFRFVTFNNTYTPDGTHMAYYTDPISDAYGHQYQPLLPDSGLNGRTGSVYQYDINLDGTFTMVLQSDGAAPINTLGTCQGIGSWIGVYVAFLINRVNEPTMEGTEIQSGATLPSSDLDVEDEYPTWTSAGVSAGFWDDAASLLRTRKMIPVALQEEGETYVTPQALARDGVVDHAGTKAKEKILDGTLDVLDEPTDWVDEGTRTIPLDVPTSPEPMNTDTPPVVLPSGTAGGPVTVYNPTQAQMDSLRTELWNNGLVTSIQALFNANPMDAIISCHMIYASPHVSAIQKGLYLGNVFMNVSGVNVVDEQFIEIDCGTVDVPELFGNATDYEPYTSVEIYLPFIGIQQLSANDVVGGSVNLVMKEDVLTGAILAEITVTKNGSTQTLYQFTGNGAVQIPLTGQDRLSQIMGGIKGALSGGFAGGVAGSFIGAASGAMASKPSIMKSGGFSPNTGAMAGKLPYLIINRNVPLDASNYNKFTGYPSNKTVKLNTLAGYTRVREVHVEGLGCTDAEKQLIETALKEGVIL